jgi:hypothetical protein
MRIALETEWRRSIVPTSHAPERCTNLEGLLSKWSLCYERGPSGPTPILRYLRDETGSPRSLVFSSSSVSPRAIPWPCAACDAGPPHSRLSAEAHLPWLPHQAISKHLTAPRRLTTVP